MVKIQDFYGQNLRKNPFYKTTAFTSNMDLTLMPMTDVGSGHVYNQNLSYAIH